MHRIAAQQAALPKLGELHALYLQFLEALTEHDVTAEGVGERSGASLSASG